MLHPRRVAHRALLADQPQSLGALRYAVTEAHDVGVVLRLPLEHFQLERQQRRHRLGVDRVALDLTSAAGA